MKITLNLESLQPLNTRLAHVHLAFAADYPGPRNARQPVHTVYAGAQLFHHDTCRRLGGHALATLDDYAPTFVAFAKAIGLDGATELPDAPEEIDRLEKYIDSDPETFRKESKTAWLALTIYRRIREKLHREPVEDFRIDFEDGYGTRPDQEEDAHAVSTARELAAGSKAGTLSPFIGIRIKPFNEEWRARSIRTLDLFVTTMAEETGGALPRNFHVTIPKVSQPEEVAALAEILGKLETTLRLPDDVLRIEIMIETPQSIFDARGQSNILALARAGGRRCVAAHFGTYDYTAGRNITAAHQHMMHPACDFAKEMMQVALAGTGIWLSDGATNVLPVPVHRAIKGGAALTAQEMVENRSAIHAAWRLHFRHIWHSLAGGFYQGWDLHPAQLPTRYASIYAFFLESLDAAADRLRNFIDKAAQATLVGEVFDDAATGQGLLNYFLRGINCGAVTPEETLKLTGLTPADLRSGSFAKILQSRTTSP
jgi:citrate lyase beta subunit